MARMLRLSAVAVFLFLSAQGCSHARPNVVMRAPTVDIAGFKPVLTTPTGMQFQPVLVIHNHMDAPVGFERVDYAVDLFDQTVITSTFSDLKEAEENGQERVTLPWQLGMSDLMAAKLKVLADGNLSVGFRGTLYPASDSGLAPVSFEQRIEVPIPGLPEITYLGSEGVPLGPDFRVHVAIKNPNGFAISVDNVDSYLELNGTRYRLVHSMEANALQPGQTQTLTLQLRNTPGKMLSMFVSVVSTKPENQHFAVGGSITCSTPFGGVFLPLRVDSP